MTDLETRICYEFRDRGLLAQALTHSSYGNQHGVTHNERLEFLGDSLLDLLVAEHLLVSHPTKREGFLSQERSEIVRMCALARCARDIGLGAALTLGRGQDHLRRVESVLADAFEALVAAVYIDSGDLQAVRRVMVAVGIV